MTLDPVRKGPDAAVRRRVPLAIREEACSLAADERDREEMRVIREQLASLAPRVSGEQVRKAHTGFEPVPPP